MKKIVVDDHEFGDIIISKKGSEEEIQEQKENREKLNRFKDLQEEDSEKK